MAAPLFATNFTTPTLKLSPTTARINSPSSTIAGKSSTKEKRMHFAMAQLRGLAGDDASHRG
jgi:hypothetical protein